MTWRQGQIWGHLQNYISLCPNLSPLFPSLSPLLQESQSLPSSLLSPRIGIIKYGHRAREQSRQQNQCLRRLSGKVNKYGAAIHS